jgi:hypothetical protein
VTKCNVIVQIAKAAAIGADLETVHLAAGPRAEIDRTPGRVIAVQRRRWPADYVDRAIHLWIERIGPRGPIRLCNRESVFEHLNVSNTERRTRVRATN